MFVDKWIIVCILFHRGKTYVSDLRVLSCICSVPTSMFSPDQFV